MSQSTLLDLPSPTVALYEDRPATTSREVAKFFGKPHDDVLKSIRRLIDATPENFRLGNFSESSYINEQGKEQPMFILYRDGLMLLIMGYTGKKAMAIKLAFLEAFAALEAQVRAMPHPSLPPAPRPRSTAIDRTSLRALVTAWSKISKMPQTVLWPQICAHFLLDQINDLPVERIPDALAWVQMKIDDVQQRALPEVSHSTPCANITIDTKTYAQGRKLFERLEKLMKDFDTAKSFVLLWGNPGTRLMRLSPEKKALYDNATDAIRMSLCGLNMAQLGLRAAMRIRADHDFAAND